MNTNEGLYNNTNKQQTNSEITKDLLNRKRERQVNGINGTIIESK